MSPLSWDRISSTRRERRDSLGILSASLGHAGWLGLPLVSVQLLARWEGETISRYVTEARLAQDYRIAAGDLHLRSLLAKSETELAGVRSQLTAVPDGLWDELATFRARSEQIVRYLELSPGSTGVREAIRDDLEESIAEVALFFYCGSRRRGACA